MLIGLTGGIGAGKSTVIGFFSEFAWQTLDSDAICHDLYKDSTCDAYTLMVERWGNRIVSENGYIDRKKVADLVFCNSQDREWLNSILHPMVFNCAVEIYTQLDATVPVIFDVPLLFEVKWEKYFTKIIAIFTTREIQMNRLLERGMSKLEIDRRIATQMTMEEKAEKADFVLVNNGSLKLLKKQCLELSKNISKSML